MPQLPNFFDASTGNFRAPSGQLVTDSMASGNLTVPFVGSLPALYDSATGAWQRLVNINTAQAGLGSGVMGMVPMLFDTVTPCYNRMLSARSGTSAFDGARIPGMADTLWDGAVGWYLKRNYPVAGFTPAALINIQPIIPAFFDKTTGLYRAPSGQAVADGYAPPAAPATQAVNMLNNGTTWDQQRGNTSVSLQSGNLAAGVTSGSAVTNYNARSAIFSLNVTVAAGSTPTLSVQIQGQNSDGLWYNIPGAVFATQSAVTGLAPLTLVLGLGAATTANVSTNYPLPRTFRYVASIGGTASPNFTFSLDADLVV